MNTLIKTSILMSGFTGLMAFADTVINNVTIDYSRLLLPVDRQGFSIPQAIVGGHVSFEGDLPIYVTLKVAGQVYTQPTDPNGAYSFLVYTGGAGSYQVEAWTLSAPVDDNAKTSAARKVVGTLPLK